MSNEGFRNGWLSEPTPVTKADLDSAIFSPMFCIAERHGIQEPKFRLISDLTKSNVDKTAQTPETYCPQGLDSFVSLARLHHVGGAGDLEQWSVDPPRAYKTIAIRPSSSEADRICFLDHVDNRPYKCRILARPLGSRRAPANWGRVATALQFSARRLLPLRSGHTSMTRSAPRAAFSARAGSGLPNDFFPYSDSILRGGWTKYLRQVCTC